VSKSNTFMNRAWRSLAFSEKIALVSMIVGTCVFLTSISFVAYMYRSDKVAYLYELQMLRARSASNTYFSKLSNGKAYGKLLAPISKLPTAKSLGIARLPEREEVFAVSPAVLKDHLSETLQDQDKKIFSVFRNVSGELMCASTSLPEPDLEDGTLHVVTADGMLISSVGGSRLTQNQVKASEIIRAGLASNLTESTNTLTTGDRKVIVSQREVPDSNILVFAEVSVSSLMLPFWEMLQLWVVFGYALILAGAGLSYFVTKKVAAPAREAAEHILKLTKGDFSIRTTYQNTDEFKVIFAGIDFLAEHVQMRERRLTAFVEGLGTILTKSATWEETWPVDDFFRKSSKLLENLLSSYSLFGFHISHGDQTYFFDIASQSLSHGHARPDDLTEVYKIKGVSHNGELQVEYGIFAHSLVDFLPETLQILTQFSETVVSYFERRQAALEQKEKGEQEREIILAAEIQRSLVNYPETIPNVQFKNVYVPAGHVGGDWTSAYYNSSSSYLYFFVGDATGHGIASSLVTAVVGGASRLFDKTYGGDIFDSEESVSFRLSELSVHLNEIVLEAGSNKIGMTMILGALNCRSGELTLINLGHPAPIWYSPVGVPEIEKAVLPNNNLLGNEEFTSPRSKTLQLLPGQGLVLFTDGLLENYSGKLKRKELKKITSSTSDIAMAVDEVTQKYHSFADGKPAGDDVAILGVQWLGDVV